jgi:hypothetical protein
VFLLGSVSAFAGDKTLSQAEKIAKIELLKKYIRAKVSLEELKRKLNILQKKEKYKDQVEEKKKELGKKLLSLSLVPQVSFQGVVGNYVLVNDYALPTPIRTQAGKIDAEGAVAYVGDYLVFPQVDVKYDTSLLQKVPAYYKEVSPPADTGFNGAIPIAPPTPPVR